MPESRPLRWGILGCAQIADTAIIPALRASQGSVVAAVASRDLAKATALAAKHGILRAYGTYAQLLADPDIDVVYLPLPISEHAHWALRCAQAGKAALVEKPFAMNAEEARQVASAFADRQLAVGEALMYRFHPLTQRVCALVAEGVLGEPTLLRATFSAAIADPHDIRWQAAMGGGALRDLGCYCISLLRLVSGSEPKAVSAVGDFAAPGVDASLAGTLHFPGGVLAQFACSLRGGFECSYDLLGTAGRIRVDHGGMVAWPDSDFSIEAWRGSAREMITIPAANHYRLMVDAFAAAVRGIAPYPVPMQETIANLTIMDEALVAARRDQPGAA